MNCTRPLATSSRFLLTTVLAVGLLGFSGSDSLGQKRKKPKKALPGFIFGEFATVDGILEAGGLQGGSSKVTKFQRTGAKVLVRTQATSVDYELILRKNGRFTYKRTVYGGDPSLGISARSVNSEIKVRGKWRTNGRDIRFSGNGTRQIFIPTALGFGTSPIKLKSRIFQANSLFDSWTWDLNYLANGKGRIEFSEPLFPLEPVR